jgi:hypothetical protein
MSDTHAVEVVFDDRRWLRVEDEATRLGIDAPQLISRATCAWLAESIDNVALVGKREAAAAE